MPPTSTSTAVSSQAMNVQPPSENATPAAAPAAPTETSNGSITPAASAATALGTNGTAAETAAVVALKASGGSATTAPAAVVVKTEDAAAAGGATGEVKTEGEQQPQAQPRRKRMRRGGWDTPAVPAVPVPTALPAAALPVNPLQEMQRKLAAEQVAAAMGQAPPVTSVAAGAVKMGLSMGALPPPVARAPVASPAVQENPRRIYVGSLHYDIKQSDVSAIFSAFGTLKLVDMSHDPVSGRHKGFCFVEYTDVKGADNALATMNGFELAGRPIKVGRPHANTGGTTGVADAVAGLPAAMQLPGMAAFMAQRQGAQALTGGAGGVAALQLKAAMASASAPPQTKVYVGNVEPHITTEMIKNIFQPFGQVVGAEMVQDPNNPGNHKGFGFIQYAQESVAKTAMETMANFELAGRNLRVAWAQDQSKPALSVIPPGLTPAAVAAQAAAAAAKVAQGVAAAAAAARMSASGHLQAALAGATGNGNGAASMLGMGGSGLVDVAAQAAQRAEIIRRMQGSRCMCLMNMLGPDDVDDEEIKADILEEAKTCGKVEQFKVHLQRSGNTVVAVRVFVVFSNNQEAAEAIKRMHGRFFGGREVRAAAYDYATFSRGMLDA